MANTLTNLIPILHRAADTVSRELCGMIPAVTLVPGAEGVAVGQEIIYPVTGSATIGDIAAAATGPDPGDKTTGNDSMTIDKSRSGTFYYTGEEELGLGGLYDIIVQQQFEQQMRALCNEVEADLCGLQAYAARAYAAHATTPVIPFGTAGDFTEAAQAVKILKDNGAPQSDLQMVLNTSAGANFIGKNSRADIVGANLLSLQQQGILLNLAGCSVRESAGIVSTAAVGNNTGGYALNGAHAKGSTTLTVKTGSGTILAGDVITIGTDTTTKYVVKTGVSNGTTIVLNAPGLMAIGAADAAIAIVGTCARQLVFPRSNIHLITRTPAMPSGGDSADDVINVTDLHSGITFQVAMYRQRRRVAYEVGLAWGKKAIKSPHLALLLGQ